MYKNLTIGALVLIIVFFMKQCHDVENISSQYKENLKIESNKFTEHKDKSGQKIIEQEQLIVNKQSDIDKLTTKVDNLSKINSQISIKYQSIIDTIEVPIDKPIYINTKDGGCLMLPANFRKLDNKWYGFTGTILERGYEEIDSLWINNEPIITFGIDKWNWKKPLKKRIPEVAFEDKNPYSSVKSLSNIKLNKPLPKFGIGIQIGYGITNKGLNPYLGIGVNYNLISF